MQWLKDSAERVAAFFSDLRRETNAQFLTVFAGYFLLSLLSFSLLEMDYNAGEDPLTFWLTVLIRSTQMTSGIVLLFSLKPRIGRIAHLALLVVAFPSFVFNVSHFIQFGALMHSGAIGAVFFSTFHQMTGYIQTYGHNAIWALVALVIGFGFLARFRFDEIRTRPKILCGALFTAMVTLQSVLVFVTVSTHYDADEFWPKTLDHFERRAYESTFFFGNDVSAITKFANQYWRFQDAREDMQDASFDVTLEDGAPEVAVVVIGESLSRHHLPFYGYPRMTTPRLQERFANDELLAFRNVVSPASITRYALMFALTRATPGNRRPFYEGKSIIAAAKSAGYETYWISNSGMFTSYDAEYTALGRQSDIVQFVSTNAREMGLLDEQLLPALDRALERNPDTRKVIFLHTLGNHAKYSRRYRPQFERFAPDAPAPKGYPELTDNERQTLNHYDNSVVYTDYFLNEVIERLENREDSSLMIFFSDHGENVYDVEPKRLGHGYPKMSKFGVEPPFLMWASDAYRTQNPSVLRSLSGNQHAPMSLTYLFQTVMDVLKIESKEWNTSRSLVQSDVPKLDRKLLTPDGKSIHTYDPNKLFYEQN